jgi:diguanylate cyclase (GGDEF)-like protein
MGRAIPGSTAVPAARPPRRVSPWRAFLVALALVLVLAISALFTGIAVSGQHAIDAEVEARARTLVASIVLARKWNSNHGGVYVEKRPGMKSNPWLANPDLTATDGRVFTLKNPALMAREMSELSKGSDGFSFRITSLKPLNPANFPDDFEASALREFESGAPEISRRERYGNSTWLRFMIPLRVEESCLACHGRQGYQVGDVRGGISVAFPIDGAEAGKARARRVTFLLFLATLGALVAAVWKLVAGLQRRLAIAEERIRDMAMTDELTGLRNRRHILHRLAEEVSRSRRTGRPLSLFMLDVDHFKRVNDQHGHDAGDAVLRSVAAMVVRALRTVDLVARYGGEEFLVLLPETDSAGAALIAERIRSWIETMRVDLRGQEIGVTASIGAATLDPADSGTGDEELLVKRADAALYRAKAAGRNQIVWAPGDAPQGSRASPSPPPGERKG